MHNTNRSSFGLKITKKTGSMQLSQRMNPLTQLALFFKARTLFFLCIHLAATKLLKISRVTPGLKGASLEDCTQTRTLGREHYAT